MFEFKTTGKTINEAIKNGLDVLKIEKEKVNFKILKNAKGLKDAEVLILVDDADVESNENIKKIKELAILDKKISKEESVYNKKLIENNNLLQELTAKLMRKYDEELTQENINALVRDYIEGIFRIVKLSDFQIEISETEQNIEIDINGKELGRFIGFKGKTLASLQFLVNIFANSISRKTKHFVVDINSYKKQKTEQLILKTQKFAKEVLENGEAVSLQPMNSFERRVVHNEIMTNYSELETISEGEEPNRFVKIMRREKK